MNKELQDFMVDLEALTVVSDMSMKKDRDAARGMDKPLRPYCINTGCKKVNKMKELIKDSVFKFYEIEKVAPNAAGIVYKIIITREIK